MVFEVTPQVPMAVKASYSAPGVVQELSAAAFVPFHLSEVLAEVVEMMSSAKAACGEPTTVSMACTPELPCLRAAVAKAMPGFALGRVDAVAKLTSVGASKNVRSRVWQRCTFHKSEQTHFDQS